jgi:hypothetical protein
LIADVLDQELFRTIEIVGFASVEIAGLRVRKIAGFSEW